MEKPTENEFLSLFRTLEKNAKTSWSEAEGTDYLTPFHSFLPSKTLYGTLPKRGGCPSLGYFTKNPIILGMNGGRIAAPTKRKYPNDHLEYLYDEDKKIRYVKSVRGFDGHLFGAFLILEGRAVLFDEEGKLQSIVLWGEEEGLSFETEISYRYLPQVEKRIMFDKTHFLSFESGPTERDATLFRFEGKDLYESVKLFHEEKKDDEIEENGVVDKAWLLEVRDAIKIETSKLGQHPSEDEVGVALESVFKKLIVSPDKIKPDPVSETNDGNSLRFYREAMKEVWGDAIPCGIHTPHHEALNNKEKIAEDAFLLALSLIQKEKIVHVASLRLAFKESEGFNLIARTAEGNERSLDVQLLKDEDSKERRLESEALFDEEKISPKEVSEILERESQKYFSQELSLFEISKKTKGKKRATMKDLNALLSLMNKQDKGHNSH